MFKVPAVLGPAAGAAVVLGGDASGVGDPGSLQGDLNPAEHKAEGHIEGQALVDTYPSMAWSTPLHSD